MARPTISLAGETLRGLPFALATFAGALLLFLVQPMIGRFILPWFGGTPAVWTTCMLFFQVVLLAGYAYAHLSLRHLNFRMQIVLHLVLLCTALALLPITPGDPWKPVDSGSPVYHILVLLSATLGLPFFVLSATSPLMQVWFSSARPGVSPYRLYALSNAGSLLALMSYPFLIEPRFSRHGQTYAWSIALAGFSVVVVWCGVIVWKRAPQAPPTQAPRASAPAVRGRWLWFALPACASVLLLAVTNTLCQDIAVVPFLWIVPLALYLLSFIISFDHARWYNRLLWLPLMTLSLGAMLWMTLGPDLTLPGTAILRPLTWLLAQAHDPSLFMTLGIYLGTLLVCCMVCHGELYRLRPAAQGLTGYYLAIAAGGALGGFAVAVLAPLLFRGTYELQIGLFAAGFLAALTLWLEPHSVLRRIWAWIPIGLVLIGLGIGLYYSAITETRDAVEISRTFYGILKVEQSYPEDTYAHEIQLMHGSTTHGLQYTATERRRIPTTYYTATSGIGRTLSAFPKPHNRHVGVVGLGTGTLAAWGRPGDSFRIYEINPDVLRLARDRFTFLTDSEAEIEVILGDARLSLEREPSRQFDILALDAFSSDAIPVHLLTREAFQVYDRHLQPEGVIAVHISNRYLDLEPVVLRIATDLGFETATISDEESEEDEESDNPAPAYSSDWVLVTRNKLFLDLPDIADAASEPDEDAGPVNPWTDESSNLFQVLILEKDSYLERFRTWFTKTPNVLPPP